MSKLAFYWMIGIYNINNCDIRLMIYLVEMKIVCQSFAVWLQWARLRLRRRRHSDKRVHERVSLECTAPSDLIATSGIWYINTLCVCVCVSANIFRVSTCWCENPRSHHGSKWWEMVPRRLCALLTYHYHTVRRGTRKVQMYDFVFTSQWRFIRIWLAGNSRGTKPTVWVVCLGE